MEAQPDSALDNTVAAAPLMSNMPAPPARQALSPKGACWYCDKPLDSVRRFCGKGCSAAFEEDAALHG